MWLDRDYSKGEFRKLLSRDIKEKMMEELALDMFCQGVHTFEIDRLRASIKPIAERLNIPVIDRQFEYIEHDIRLCSFLTMDFKENCYRFAHQSFFEFFVAQALKSIVNGGLTEDAFAWQYITDEIMSFLAEMIEEEGDAKDTSTTLRTYLSDAEQVKKMPMIKAGMYFFTNVLRLYCRLTGGRKGIQLKNVPLPLLNLENKDLQQADFSSTEMSDLFLKDVRLNGVSTVGAIIKRAKLANCYMPSTSFADSSISAASFNDCDLKASDFSQAKLEGITFNHCKLNESKFSRANMKSVKFIDSDITQCNFTGANIPKDSIKIIRSNSDRIIGIPVEILRFIVKSNEE